MFDGNFESNILTHLGNLSILQGASYRDAWLPQGVTSSELCHIFGPTACSQPQERAKFVIALQHILHCFATFDLHEYLGAEDIELGRIYTFYYLATNELLMIDLEENQEIINDQI